VTTYVDSSVLVPLYVPERFSKRARGVVQSTPQVPYTLLHQLELANAFALLAGRSLISEAERSAVLTHLHEDVTARRLAPTHLEWPDVFEAALQFSTQFSAQWLTRSLDLLHVASAHAAGCSSFVSADDRQLAVAKATGLKTIDIKSRRGSRK
jgi:predicted nucleic acid-binding protein